ncbi:hypothetical protein [uncultured Desulfuromonas sp.]|uniref:hypothetical protein n=1 Tax=uncultured Desulfuromonas sp. TaxID=181013 RepID=UPI002AAB778F|nr:hypothetical protein [uncultured Desulfuromonas sp.]
MSNVMITAARPERLKIVSFLLRLAGWEVQSSASLLEAMNYLKNADVNDNYFDLLVVVDYRSLAESTEERLFESQCLEMCSSLQRPVAILICGNDLDCHEKKCLIELTRDGVDFCQSEKLVGRIEEIHDALNRSLLQATT